MSSTLATLLSQLDPGLRILMVERQRTVALESSDGWNNAGTGHAGYCELNYTPENKDGSIDVSRALKVNSDFEHSLQFWSYLVEENILPSPGTFINPTAHKSFVWGDEDVNYLRLRYHTLVKHPLFKDMEFSSDFQQLQDWMPLVMSGRDKNQKLAATSVKYGSDIDFGALSRSMVQHLVSEANFELALSSSVNKLKKQHGHWHIGIRNNTTNKNREVRTRFVFLGAGGATLRLLQKSGIPESKGYGGFPVSGQWLVCNNPMLINMHSSKVYGKAPLGAPPMSVPHLDTRIIDGKPALLFGPYAGFTTKFLKQGSYRDLFSSIKPGNFKSILSAGKHNMDLTRYLIREVFQTHQSRVAALKNFYPEANEKDWSLSSAGKRVQIIKKCDERGGRLEFGTEIVTSKDGSLAALLGASPGASTSVKAMVEVLEKCYLGKEENINWKKQLKRMIPSYGESLIDDPALLHKIREKTLSVLRLS